MKRPTAQPANERSDDAAKPSLFVLRRRKEKYRKKLDTLLARADDESFLRMLWAADAIESERPDRQQAGWRWFSTCPANIVQALRRGPFFHKWQLETLANELFAAAKHRIREGRASKRLDCHHLGAAVEARDLLRHLENAEDGLVLSRVSVLTEMHRLGQRQFPWQRGKVTKAALFRTSYLYAFPEAEAAFLARYGVSIEAVSMVAFAMYTLLQEHSGVVWPSSLTELGLDGATVSKALSILSMDIPAARVAARRLRSSPHHVGYVASVLRQAPLIRVHSALIAPIPDLIIDRITEGLYYDITGTGGSIPNEIGRRFEAYCADLCRGYLGELTVNPEFNYGAKNQQQASPDLMLLRDGNLRVAIECKAKKEPIAAKFGEEQSVLAGQHIDELAKGIFQLWRFFSHSRCGLVANGPSAQTDTIGVLLMLDTWMEASDGQRAEVLRRAHDRADAATPAIPNEDRRSVALCHIDGFEHVLRQATDDDLLRTLALATGDEHQGWHLDMLYRQLPNANPIEKNDPFERRLHDVVKWMKLFEERLV
jgi:hypothetical protein